MFRRRPDPRELASVLHRLERLQIVGQPAGWLPPAPDAEQPPPATGGQGWRARLRAAVSARLHLSAFDPGRRGVAVLVVVAVVGASGGAWYFLRAAPHVRADPPPTDCQTVTGQEPGSCLTVGSGSARSPTESAAPTDEFVPIGSAASPSGPPSPSKASELVVDIVGKVAKPGVFTLPPGSRIVDAIAAAGGVLPHTDLTALDLARKLSDGQEIFVGVAPPSGAAAMSGGGGRWRRHRCRRGRRSGQCGSDRQHQHRHASRAGDVAWSRHRDGAEDPRLANPARPLHQRHPTTAGIGHWAGEVCGSRRSGEGVKPARHADGSSESVKPRAADMRVELMPGEPVELRLLIPAGAAWLTAAIALMMSAAVGLVAATVLLIVGAAIGPTMFRSRRPRHHVRRRVVAAALLCAAGAAAAAAWRVAAVQRGPLPSLARAHAAVTLELIVTSDPHLSAASSAGSSRSLVVLLAKAVEVSSDEVPSTRISSPIVVLATAPGWLSLQPTQRVTAWAA